MPRRLLAALLLVACDSPPEDVLDDAGPADADPAWITPDPAGRTTPGNLVAAAPEMLVITSEKLAAAWRDYAWERDLAGVRTEVVTVESIVAARPDVDAAASLRDELIVRQAGGTLRFVLLGGDAQEVPYRRVIDEVTVMGETYSTNGPCELYFADVTSDWDIDDDGLWGEDGDDLSLEELRGPELAVGRVPASTVEEVATYLAKVDRYEAESARAAQPLLLSDIATTLAVIGDIDAAEGIEPTVAATFSATFQANATRLYATQDAVDAYGGQLLTPPRVAAALRAGSSLVFHEGHGSYDALTDVLGNAWVEALDNELPPIFASCACLAGNFADVADDSLYTDWSEQTPDLDSVGEKMIVRPHGAVAYIGNTAVGLGPVGGSQFLHALFAALFGGTPRLGEAFNAGHRGLRDVDLTMSGVPMSLSDASERWTHLEVILLGDPSLEAFTDTPALLALGVPESYGPGYQEMSVSVTRDGAPAGGVLVIAGKAGDFLVHATSGADGVARFSFIPVGRGPLDVEARESGAVRARATIPPR